MKAVARIVAGAPPAQLPDVVSDVRTLAGGHVSKVNAALPGLIAEHAAREYTPVQLPGNDGRRALLTAEGLREGEPTTFYEPATRQIMHVDFGLSGDRLLSVPVCTSLSPLPTAEAAALGPAEPARAALESAMRAYAADAYPSAVLSVYGRVGEDGRVRVVACLSACAANLPNFHAGAVRARWELVLPAAGAGPDAQLSGEVSARVHYFEDGNAQLDARESWSVALPLGGEGADALDVLALNAVARVKQAEGEWHASLLDRFRSLSDSGIKALRRPLPMTKTKFEFEKVAQHRLSDQLANMRVSS